MNYIEGVTTAYYVWHNAEGFWDLAPKKWRYENYNQAVTRANSLKSQLRCNVMVSLQTDMSFMFEDEAYENRRYYK